MALKLPCHVWADFGGQVDGVDGEILAHAVNGPTNIDGEVKYGIQTPNGHTVPMALTDRPSGGGYFRPAPAK